ncbi:hypothetical protein AMR41_08250 [Hapalosiphon sp. MRB220]|nr:hypothetical protein AMR41_08250 [Hapalosiphon sp. MRB220]
MQLQKCQFLPSYGFEYNNENQTLRVKFLDTGIIIDYHHVPQEIFDKLKKINFKGSDLKNNVLGRYGYRYINPPQEELYKGFAFGQSN